MARSPRRWLALLLVIVVLLLLWWQSGRLLTYLGGWLNVDEPPVPADYVFVFPGDQETRPFVAAALVNKGWASAVLVPEVYRDPSDEQVTPPSHEVIARVVRFRGVPEENVTILPAASTSTFEDALALNRFLQQHPKARVLAVTSSFHTRRTRWVLARVLGERFQRVHIVGAPCERFWPERWWTTYWGFQAVTGEYLKLLYYALRYGMLGWWIAGLLVAVFFLIVARRLLQRAAGRRSSGREH